MFRRIWSVTKLASKYLRSKDTWASVEVHVPLHLFGRGSVREFDWYFEGASTVPISNIPSLCDWLAECEYVGDDRLFRHEDFWQHPCTFEQLRRGDCEDHALWAWRKLIEMGKKAELICGAAKVDGSSILQSGHAWVVFHDATGSFLLEPTTKDAAVMVRSLEDAKASYVPLVSVDHTFNRRMYGGVLYRARELVRERDGGYSELQGGHILQTIATLECRITERFPGSGLSRVGAELGRLAVEVCAPATRLRWSIWLLRTGACLGVLGIMAITVWHVDFGLSPLLRPNDPASLLQASYRAVNEIVLLAIVVFFIITLEGRVKRRAALKVLHRVRSVLHLVDMHQLRKDPGYLLTSSGTTASSPKRDMKRFELARYLDCCSELLSLTSKVAALVVQHVRDPVVLAAVGDIERLTASLSNTVWQKITILGFTRPEEGMQRGDRLSYSDLSVSVTVQGIDYDRAPKRGD